MADLSFFLGCASEDTGGAKDLRLLRIGGDCPVSVVGGSIWEKALARGGAGAAFGNDQAILCPDRVVVRGEGCAVAPKAGVSVVAEV